MLAAAMLAGFLSPGCRQRAAAPVDNPAPVESTQEQAAGAPHSYTNGEKPTFVIVKQAGTEKNNWFKLDWFEPWEKISIDKAELALENPRTGVLFTVSVEWKDGLTRSDLLAYTQNLPERLESQGENLHVEWASYTTVGDRDAYRIFFSNVEQNMRYEMDQTIVIFDGGVLHFTARAFNAFTVADKALLDAMLQSLQVYL